MRFDVPLVTGRLIKRYKRFLADVALDDGGAEITAHCANSGSMMGLKDPGIKVWLTPNDDPKRKLKYSWEMLEIDGAMVGINTSRPNGLVEEAIEAGRIPELVGYEKLRREVKYGKNSRIDILLEGEGDKRTYVEVKNVTLAREDGIAEFPDAVTARGAKHLDELADMVREGHRSAMVFLIQRDDCDALVLARDIDPKYGEAFDAAVKAGVEIYAIGCRLDTDEIIADRSIEVRC
ncbi:MULTISPECIES: DNA/RNA nuclease SfsA [unclassified Pseudovibrio]|uniref:DNA/RNA nuclease SfsA n=1 Tax=unclassified Pseudovibrio TaxID=2627060 RepID=UPI0007AEA132|nr:MULTISPECIES: DNA/RNA nuclease SfsA [unclassified Pseudovibrio]KZL05631.1 Sugar fermentation stimulation protein A [Pseudovibrio sp. Ad26]KZL23023.1 Sugar fermentation stimulation protein A [Pseudovibrio sp. WM33]